MRLLIATALVLSALATTPPVYAAAPVMKVGQCVATTLKSVGTRLEGVADSGDQVEYANGIYGVSYEQDPAIAKAHKGDKVSLCLSSVPTGCPKGDDRGKIYKATDLRTRKSWSLPDAEHMCGGA